MTASKESAAIALRDLKVIADRLEMHERNRLSATLIRLEEFLNAAGKRLPTEAAIARDRARKTVKK